MNNVLMLAVIAFSLLYAAFNAAYENGLLNTLAICAGCAVTPATAAYLTARFYGGNSNG